MLATEQLHSTTSNVSNWKRNGSEIKAQPPAIFMMHGTGAYKTIHIEDKNSEVDGHWVGSMG